MQRMPPAIPNQARDTEVTISRAWVPVAPTSTISRFVNADYAIPAGQIDNSSGRTLSLNLCISVRYGRLWINGQSPDLFLTIARSYSDCHYTTTVSKQCSY